MAYETILYEVSDNGLTITHNRVDSLNAFALEMGQELVEALVSVLVLKIAGHCLDAEDAARSGLRRAAGDSP
jgi:hypothetical protein